MQPFTAGASIAVRVRGVDANFNLDTNAAAQVNLVTADPWDAALTDQSLINGVTQFTAVMVTTGTYTMTVTDVDGTPLTAAVSGAAQVVAGAASPPPPGLPGGGRRPPPPPPTHPPDGGRA